MGFFSWETSDTKQSVANNCQSKKECKVVYLLQPGGKDSIEEESYSGYGIFGGVDAYAWIARMNMPQKYTAPPEQLTCTDEERLAGIRMEDQHFKGDIVLEYPLKLSFNKNAVYEKLPAAHHCKHQGYFYTRRDKIINIQVEQER